MATLRVASQVPYFEIVSGMFFVFPQVECLGANSCCHELVARWVKETTEPPVSRELQPPQVPTATREPLTLGPRPGDFSGGKTRFPHGVKVWNLNSANLNSNAGLTCNETLIGHKLRLAQEAHTS